MTGPSDIHSVNLNNGVNEKLTEIKNFMHRIAKY
jgi:hypothetical protein